MEGYEYSIEFDIKPQIFLSSFSHLRCDAFWDSQEGEQSFPESAQQAAVFVSRVFLTVKKGGAISSAAHDSQSCFKGSF